MSAIGSGRDTASPSRGGEVVLAVSDLKVDYGIGRGALHAVDGVDLELHRGEVLGVAGESGSGKSTLAYAMTRLLRPPGVITGGDVFYHPRIGEPIDILGLSDENLRLFRWSELAIVFQNAMSALNPVLSLRSQIFDVLAAHSPRMTRVAKVARMTELMSMVGISADRGDAYPHELSGGMRQRAMIAIALALEPEIIVLDEPTTALDVVMQQQILAEIMGLRDRLGFSVIFITHDLSLLLEVADTIVVMYAGRVVEKADASELYRSARHPYSDGLLHSFPLLRGRRQELTGIPGSPPDLRSVPSGCAFHPRCPHAMATCKTIRPELGPTDVETDTASHEVACHLYGEAKPPPPELLGQKEASGVN